MTQSEKEIPQVTPKEQKKHQKPKKPRCSHKECRKKLGLISFTCKCDQTFCVAHQSPHSHDCSYDHGQDKRNDIQTMNPSVIPQKLVVV
jgi:predicted nucleic acid binding AN1-type Zn finger protein